MNLNYDLPISYPVSYIAPNILQETLETLMKDAFLGTKMSEIEAKQENMEEMIKVIYNNIGGNNPGMNPLS